MFGQALLRLVVQDDELLVRRRVDGQLVVLRAEALGDALRQLDGVAPDVLVAQLAVLLEMCIRDSSSIVRNAAK